MLVCICLHAQKGKNGPLTVSSTIIVNEYTSLTANAISGSTSITVANSSLNTYGRFSASLSAGDLIMIIQIQGATIKGAPDAINPAIATPDDSSWGAILNYNNCGNNEIREVLSIPNSTTINLSCALANNYSYTGKVEVVRIPRLSSLTINSGGNITCDPWDSTVGGVVAIEVANNTIINSGGNINASSTGFRGGQLFNNGTIPKGITYFGSNQTINGAYKGESIAGYGNDYNQYGGSTCLGAPANGGGGGDSWNGGGGGGANAGAPSKWINGFGVPDISKAGYATAWNQEYSWMSAFIGSGGGRGGYTWCSNKPDPLTNSPGNSIWQGDNRRSVGGRGGRPLDYSTGRLFFGGGGGAGHEDNGHGTAGGNGGGLIYLISYGTISGTGNIISNGQSALGDSLFYGDGSGGAGAGGAIVVNSTGNISGVTIQANGGTGGNQTIPASDGEGEGPGGGGGGGYITTTNSVTEMVNGGANGTTLSFPTFPPNGATMGSNGIISIIPGNTASILVTDTVFCKGDSAHFSGMSSLYSGPGSATWSWIFTGGTPSTSSLQNQSVYYKNSGIYPVKLIVTSCSGSDTVTRNVNIIVTSLSGITVTGNNPLCSNGGSDTLVVHGGSSYAWSTGSTSSSIAISPVSNTTYSVTVNKGSCSWDTTITVMTTGSIKASISKDTSICPDSRVTLTAKGGTIYNWSNGATTNSITVSPNATNNYFVVVGVGGCKDTTLQTKINVYPGGTLSACCSATIQLGDSVVLTASGSGNYLWIPSGESLCDTCAKITVRPNSTTTYTVESTDSIGCKLKDSVIITVEGCGIVWLPNAFTPNGDELNDLFYPKGACIVSYTMYIFDRWGTLIYQTTTSKPWNGQVKNDGITVQEDTYVYELIINTSDRVQRSYIGKVTVIN